MGQLENKDFPAFPCENYKEFADDLKSGFKVNGGINPTGLTKREYFSITILQGLSSVPNTGLTANGLAKKAIELADELGKLLSTPILNPLICKYCNTGGHDVLNHDLCEKCFKNQI